MLRDVGSSLCGVPAATASKCLGLGFPPAAAKELQAGLCAVQTNVAVGDVSWKPPFIQLHWDAVLGVASACSPQSEESLL